MRQTQTEPSKFARYRTKKQADGKILLRLWVPDLGSPQMREALARDLETLRGAPEQAEATAFLEAIEAEDGWPE